MQLQKNIEELMERTRLQAAQDSLNIIEHSNVLVTNDTMTRQYKTANMQKDNPVNLFSNPLKAKSKSLKQKTFANKKENTESKAVMQRRDEE